MCVLGRVKKNRNLNLRLKANEGNSKWCIEKIGKESPQLDRGLQIRSLKAKIKTQRKKTAHSWNIKGIHVTYI